MFDTTPSIPNYNIIFKKKSFVYKYKTIYKFLDVFTIHFPTIPLLILPIILEYKK